MVNVPLKQKDRVMKAEAMDEIDIKFACLGSEVAMEETFRVKVAHAFGRVTSDLHTHLPR